jgi:CheY-like chemotaxis protein
MPDMLLPAPILVGVADEQLRFLLSLILEQGTPHRVLLAQNGGEVLRLFSAHRPCLVLLDTDLPGMENRSFHARISILQVGTQIPILVMGPDFPEGVSVHRSYIQLGTFFDLKDLVTLVQQLAP